MGRQLYYTVDIVVPFAGKGLFNDLVGIVTVPIINGLYCASYATHQLIAPWGIGPHDYNADLHEEHLSRLDSKGSYGTSSSLPFVCPCYNCTITEICICSGYETTNRLSFLRRSGSKKSTASTDTKHST